MYIKKNTLIGRPGYFGGTGGPGGPGGHSALSGAWDEFVSGFSSFAKGFSSQPGMSPGMGPGMPGYNPDLAAAYAAQQNQGIGLTDILLVGGVGAAAYFLLKKKRAA